MDIKKKLEEKKQLLDITFSEIKELMAQVDSPKELTLIEILEQEIEQEQRELIKIAGLNEWYINAVLGLAMITHQHEIILNLGERFSAKATSCQKWMLYLDNRRVCEFPPFHSINPVRPWPTIASARPIQNS